MKSMTCLVCAAVAALVFGTAFPVRAAYDAFLKIDGIDGESVDRDYADWIEIESFSFGLSNSGGSFSGGGGAGKAVFIEFATGKRLDKATPKLMLACASGKHIPEVVLILRKAGENPIEYFEVKLTDVLVSSSSLEGTVEEDRPSETLALNYGRIEWIYTPVEPDGSAGEVVRAGWNLVENVPVN